MWSLTVTRLDQASHGLKLFILGSECWMCFFMVVSSRFMDMTGNKVVTFFFFFRNAFGLQNHVAFRKSQGG